MAKLLSGTRIYGNATVDTNLLVSGNTTSTNSSTGALTVSGGVGIVGNLNVSNSVVVSGGIQNTPIGNSTPNSAQFTTVNSSSNTTVNALTINNSATVGGTLGVTGNVNGNGVTLTGSLTATGSGDFDGGLQSTPIGNASASTGQFTTVSATSNITGAALTSNGSITAITSMSALGGLQNTPIGNVSPSTALFTTVGTSGNSTAAALTVNGTATIGSTLGVSGNVTANGLTITDSATIGNTLSTIGVLTAAAPVLANWNQGAIVTPVGSGVSIGDSLYVNDSAYIGNTVLGNGSGFLMVDGTAEFFLTSNLTSAFSIGSGSGPIFQIDTLTGQDLAQFGVRTLAFFRNTASAISTSNAAIRSLGGMAISKNLIVGTNVTVGTTLTANAGIQNTTIGNVTPSTALFTTVGTSGNTTANALTVNGTATIGSTLGVTGNINGNGITLTGSLVASGSGDFDGGLQSTPIGNASASTGQFTTVSATGNITAAALTSNGSATVGSTLQARAGIQNTAIGNVTPSSGQFTTIQSSGLATLNSFYANTDSTVAGNLTVDGNLVVSGNVIASGSNNTYFTDSIIELHTAPNLANLTFNDGKDIGIRFHYYKTENSNAFLGWQNETGYLEWLGAGATENINANVITGSYGTIKTGELILANSTISTSTGSGALVVAGGAGVAGNIYAGNYFYANGLQAVGPQGPQGPIGNTGPQGPTGPQGALQAWSVKDSNYTAVNGDRLLANTLVSGNFTILLPATPPSGAYVQVSDAGNLAVVPVTVGRNGSTIEGLTDDVNLTIAGTTYEFIYDGITWEVTATTGARGPQGPQGPSGAGGSISISDEGTLLTNSASSINFVGSGVTANVTGTDVTVTISGGGSGTPGGSDTQVQFNDSGSFGGNAAFTFSKTTGNLTTSNLIAGNTTTGGVFANTVTFNGTAANVIAMMFNSANVSIDFILR